MLFNEPKLLKYLLFNYTPLEQGRVSVLFNEPKLLKLPAAPVPIARRCRFSALQRAEIAEIADLRSERLLHNPFQCSSTSRNC